MGDASRLWSRLCHAVDNGNRRRQPGLCVFGEQARFKYAVDLQPGMAGGALIICIEMNVMFYCQRLSIDGEGTLGAAKKQERMYVADECHTTCHKHACDLGKSRVQIRHMPQRQSTQDNINRTWG